MLFNFYMAFEDREARAETTLGGFNEFKNSTTSAAAQEIISLTCLLRALGFPIQNFFLNSPPHYALNEIGSITDYDFSTILAKKHPLLKNLDSVFTKIESESADFTSGRIGVTEYIDSNQSK
jgi:hypothetical protein